MQQCSTLNHRTNGTACVALVAYVRDRARIAKDALDRDDPVGPRHVAALNDFAQFVEARGLRDERIYVLDRIGGWWADGKDFEPGPQVQKLFGLLGAMSTAAPVPSPDSTLNELVAAAVDDLLASTNEERGVLSSQLKDAEARAAQTPALEEERDRERGRADGLAGDLEAANATIVSQREQVEHLRTMVGGSKENRAKEDWKRVGDGYEGVYEKRNAAGETTYKIGWREDGKQRWLATGTDKDEARTKRAKIIEKLEAVPC